VSWQELKGYASPEKLLLSSGAPILRRTEAAGNPESIGNKILVGWKRQAREARRAGRRRAPLFLVAASSVTLLVVDFGTESPPGTGEDPGADIALYISRGTVPTSK